MAIGTYTVREMIRWHYHSMLRRCYRKQDPTYKFYGGRGVRVCKEWKNDFNSFYEWSITNGWQKGYHLDKDRNGDGMMYSPEFCLWVTPQENFKYKRNIKFFEYNNEKLLIPDLAIKLNLREGILRYYLYGKGYTVQEVIDHFAKTKGLVRSSTLSVQDVIELRKLRKSGLSCKEIAAIFKIAPSSVSGITNGKRMINIPL